MGFLTVVILISICSLLVLSAPAGDRITSLPNFAGQLLSPQYSGYINIDSKTGKSLHYWFIQSLGNPTTDPVVLWMNGGPGCSSMDGLFYEMGPIHFVPGNEGNPQINWNPYSWVNISSMIFVEAPAGVGFSYSNDDNDYNTNDTKTANDNYNFLLNWIKAFPEFAKNDFWVSGESYAGVYVPTLANLVLTGSQNGEFSMNFKGVLVGNGVTPGALDRNPIQEMQFFYGHGMYPDSDQNAIVAACTKDPNSGPCQDAVDNANAHFEDSPINWYNIYGECDSQRPLRSEEFSSGILRKKFAGKSIALPTRNKKRNVQGVPPCIDANSATSYLNMASVKAAIHVKSDITWTICSDIINYNPDVNNVLPIYSRLTSAGKRVLIYNGDTDAVVDYTYSAWWTENLGLTSTRSWAAWTFNDMEGQQTGGWVTDYTTGITFATIRGAGHMVPQYRPAAAYAMFSRFINGQPL